MKRLICLILVAFTLFLSVSCVPENDGIIDNNTKDPVVIDPDESGDKEEEKPSPDYPDDEIAAFNDFFNPENHVSLDLDISDSELKKIQSDYDKYSSMGSKSPIYRMADLTITVTRPDGSIQKWTYDQVGVRMKGNTSRTSFYNDHDGMYNLVHFKISFKETFDDEEYYGSDAINWENDDARKARKDRTFATLEKIDIRWNRNDDTTYIRESYAYDLYREFGVLAPHTNLASVDIGDDHAGVWVVYEPIDDIFLEKNLPESALGGDLYKLGWTNEGATFTSFTSYGVEDEDKAKFYVYDLKTNKKKSTHQSLKNLINTLNSSSISKESFASVVDVDNFMYYCAVAYMVGNCDDLRHNYNNSYIYFRADTGKMMVIPYDIDRGLGVNVWNPYGHGMTQDNPFSKQSVTGDQKSPLFLKSVCRGGFFIDEYIEALKEVDGSDMLTVNGFAETFNRAKELYSNDTTPSRSYHNAGNHKFRFDINRTCNPSDSSNMSFKDYITAKRETLYDAIGDQGNDGENTGGGSENTGGNGGSSGGEVIPPSDPITDCDPYVMSDLNSWDYNSSYKMTNEGNGLFSYSISCVNGFRIKIRDRNSGEWYGSEVVDPNCNVWYAPDKHTNIYLDSGRYTITFDTNTGIIYLEKH